MRALRFTGNLNGIDSVGMEKAVALRRLGRCGLLGSGVGGGLSDRGIDWFCEFRRCCLAGLYWLIFLGFCTFVSSAVGVGSCFVPSLGMGNNSLMAVFLLLLLLS